MAKIVQIGVDEYGDPIFLDSDGRLWFKSMSGWKELASYPPGCDPNEPKETHDLTGDKTPNR